LNATDTAEEYLRRCGAHPDLYDFGRCKDAFLSDMKAGLQGEPSSMKMIPAYLSTRGRLPAAGSAVALDIGGTNLRIALVSCRGGALHIERLEEFPVPGLTREITKEEVFGELAGRLKPYVQTSGAVGVCFSHAAEILPDLDGKLISFSKEIRVAGSEGMLIAKELAGALHACRAGETIRKYVVVNDTAAALLGGAAGSGNGGLIGFVLGTGMNLCYEEENAGNKKA
jgi:hexokinase